MEMANQLRHANKLGQALPFVIFSHRHPKALAQEGGMWPARLCAATEGLTGACHAADAKDNIAITWAFPS